VILRLRDRELDLARPVIVGIVNATPDSFSDRQGSKDPGELAERGLRLMEEGAAIVDVGGETERLAERGALVSADTWRGPVARAALEAGARMVNDVSGLSDESVAAACAEAGAALVITHTTAPPKTKVFPHYDDVVTSVREFLEQRAAAARAAGVGDEHIVLDPGIDIAKSPAESVELLRRLPELAELGPPLLLAVSRKDFVGALTERPPAERDAGTLAAVGAAADGGAKIVRVHDVAGTRDFLRVHDALRHGTDDGLALAPELRREAV
jgi:dihydropteroate synthase